MSLLYVKIFYGTSNTFNNNIHKPQLLHGVKVRLQKLGFRVDLIPIDVLNHCIFQMCGYEVFCCNITNLKFNTRVTRDVVATRAVDAVVSAAAKIRHARAYLWLWNLLDQEMFRRTQYTPHDYWPEDFKPITFAPCTDCTKCCKILVTKRKDDDKEKVLI